jgi:histidinol-phosphatase (PHP family)
MKDFHIHPDYSIDSKGSVEEYIQAAIYRGLDSICFTTHIDLNPRCRVMDYWMRLDGRYSSYSDEAIERYVSHVRQATSDVSERIDVYCGFEFSYNPEFENTIREFLQKHPADFTIGSIHRIDEMCFVCSREIYYFTIEHTPNSFIEQYVELVIRLAESGLFDTIGHLDGYRKYIHKFWDDKELRDAELMYYPKLFRRLAELQQGFEINTSALRRGQIDFYPHTHLLELARDNGAFVNSISSDAHRPNQVGDKLSEAKKHAETIGIEIREPFHNSTKQ